MRFTVSPEQFFAIKDLSLRAQYDLGKWSDAIWMEGLSEILGRSIDDLIEIGLKNPQGVEIYVREFDSGD